MTFEERKRLIEILRELGMRSLSWQTDADRDHPHTIMEVVTKLMIEAEDLLMKGHQGDQE